MGTRPRTAFVKKLKNRRCGKCGVLVGRHAVRCKRCSGGLRRPKK